jgi:CRP/FNR family transcriptional regulator
MSTNAQTGIPTFETSTESIIAHFSSGHLMHFSNGETIINGLDEPKGIYLIKEGFVKACSVAQAGHENLLVIHKVDEIIPLPWALDGVYATGLFYEAMTDVSVLRTSKNSLRTALGNNAWLAQEILNQSVNIITAYTQRIQTLEYRTARGQTIARLLALSERFGEKHGKKILINVPMTHQDIADSINLSRETASRVLESLFGEGLLVQSEHHFSILDLPKLQLALS